jgi:hypothetical protein
MFCKKVVMMSFHDLCFKFILCRDVNEFLKYHDIISDLLKSVDHEDVEVNFNVAHA